MFLVGCTFKRRLVGVDYSPLDDIYLQFFTFRFLSSVLEYAIAVLRRDIFFKPVSAHHLLQCIFLRRLGGRLGVFTQLCNFPCFSGLTTAYGRGFCWSDGCFCFISTYTPDQEIRLFFFNVKLKYVALAFVVLDVIQIPYGNAGGHLAHIGEQVWDSGMPSSFKNGKDIGAPFAQKWYNVCFNCSNRLLL